MDGWVFAGTTDEFGSEDVFGAVVEGQAVAVYKVGGEIFATQDLCTHGQARLSDGYLEGCHIECPLHQGMFDVKTGAPTAPPCTEPLQTYATKVDGEKIYILWPEQ